MRIPTLTYVSAAVLQVAGCLLPEVYSTLDGDGEQGTASHVSASAAAPPDDATRVSTSQTISPTETSPSTQRWPASTIASMPGAAGTMSASVGMMASVPAGGANGMGEQSAPAMCTGGPFRCDGKNLLRCVEAEGSYEPAAECTSATLCDAAAGSCKLAACAPNTTLCQNNTLTVCNSDGTDFRTTSCGGKSCNQAKSRCDLCEPYAKKCDGDTTLLTCDANGQVYNRTTCPRHCRNGVCVECVVDAECPPLAGGDCRHCISNFSCVTISCNQ